MIRFVTSLAVVGLLAACAPNAGDDASVERVAAAAYQAPGPNTLTIFTMVNNRTGAGGHTSLMVNGSQRVIFDPAGSFRDPRMAERADVLYGVTPGWLQAYKSAHARASFHVVSQEIVVTQAQAERAMQLVRANGPVAGAFCANSTTNLLRQVPGFEGIKTTFYPVKFMEQLEAMPGVTTTRYYENDEGDVIDALRAAQLAKTL
ncbi:hypothetical protein SAMN04488523_101339 [Sulfitobacter brevis]|uniref:Lipoprotein n=1 Tax=Sulfitobacter brevis TaxID=74348 RepID=A0A1I1TKF3_9RHOB|nr:hypothetical protein SAMN04488523_101339 [Sulfitobacter brevis]